MARMTMYREGWQYIVGFIEYGGVIAEINGRRYGAVYRKGKYKQQIYFQSTGSKW